MRRNKILILAIGLVLLFILVDQSAYVVNESEQVVVTQFGKPIGEFQLIQAKLADIYGQLNACRAYVYSTANRCDQEGW